MKRILPLCIIVLVCAAAILLAANVLVGVRSDAKQTEPQTDTNVNATPAQAGAPADSISEETELFASLSSAAVEQAYKTADGYKELYLKLFSGSGLNLTQDEIAPLAARLGELGCCASALNCSIDMTNPALLNDFFAPLTRAATRILQYTSCALTLASFATRCTSAAANIISRGRGSRGSMAAPHFRARRPR